MFRNGIVRSPIRWRLPLLGIDLGGAGKDYEEKVGGQKETGRAGTARGL
jgi:hypothetical protein